MPESRASELRSFVVRLPARFAAQLASVLLASVLSFAAEAAPDVSPPPWATCDGVYQSKMCCEFSDEFTVLCHSLMLPQVHTGTRPIA